MEQPANTHESNGTARAQEAAEQAGAYVMRHTPEEMLNDARANADALADDLMTRTGRRIHDLARRVREGRSEGQLSEAANLAADALDRGGRYLEERDLSGVRADLERIIRRYPLQAVLAGAGLGLLFARRRK